MRNDARTTIQLPRMRTVPFWRLDHNMSMTDDFNESYVTVSKKELLEFLRANSKKHREIFLKACDGYRVKAIQVLDSMLDDAKKGLKVRQSIELVEPQDHTSDYDRVIRMLEMSQAENIKISESQFRCYVLDEWQWMGQFLGSTQRYLAGR